MVDSFLNLRKNVLDYTNMDMNLELSRDDQVYIAVVDIPTFSGIVGNEYMSLAMIFGLNCHLYLSNGEARTGLEKDAKVMRAMQSMLVSSHQVLKSMELTDAYEFKPSEKRRVFLKTTMGVYFKEIDESKESSFLNMMIDNVLKHIGECTSV